MQRYQVPMLTVEVTLCFVDHRRGRFRVFLSSAPNAVGRGETLDGYLNDERSFLPCQESKGGALRFVLKRHIASLEVDSASPYVEKYSGIPPTSEVNVEVRCTTGEDRHGVVRIFNPPETSRLSDFLNGSETFFPVHEGRQVVYLNKGIVLAVEPVFEMTAETLAEARPARKKAAPSVEPSKAVKLKKPASTVRHASKKTASEVRLAPKLKKKTSPEGRLAPKSKRKTSSKVRPTAKRKAVRATRPVGKKKSSSSASLTRTHVRSR